MLVDVLPDQRRKLGIVPLDDPLTLEANHVLVLAPTEDVLVVVVVRPEPDLPGQARLDEKVEGAVDRRPGDPGALLTHLQQELLGLDVTVEAEERLDDLLPLLGQLEALLPQPLPELLRRRLPAGSRRHSHGR